MSGELPIIGVNTFLSPTAEVLDESRGLKLMRATEEEKAGQLRRLKAFQDRHRAESPAALARLQEVALSDGNIFAELMRTVRSCSLGQIAGALYEVGGQYRRTM
jgi:methylmalonyl-CoA mutase